MTAGTGARVPTEQQLADILRFVARTCLEVERGLRPPAHLTELMDPAHRWIEPGQLGLFRAGPVRCDHIGEPQISRLTASHIIGTVITRTEGDRWGALSLELRPRNGRWHITDLQRLLAVGHYRTPHASAQLNVPVHDVRAEIAEIAEARRMAQAASGASSLQLAELAPGSSGYRAAVSLSRYWQRIVRDLDYQLASYEGRERADRSTKPPRQR